MSALTRSSSSVAEHRRRARGRGLQRVEVQVSREDAGLVRAIAQALADPDRVAETRAYLLGRFASERVGSLKALLASAPLDDIDLDRSRAPGRPVEL